MQDAVLFMSARRPETPPRSSDQFTAVLSFPNSADGKNAGAALLPRCHAFLKGATRCRVSTTDLAIAD